MGRAWFRHGEVFGCVDQDGNVVIPAKFDWAGEFSDGLAVVNTGRINPYSREKRRDRAERYGFVDRSGRLALAIQYSYAGRFSDGLALIQRPGIVSYEYIGPDGSVVFSLSGVRPHPRCFVGYASEFSNGRATVLFDGNPTAKPFAVFVDKAGQIIGPVGKYDNAGSFSEERARVTVEAKVGYVDLAGGLAIPTRFDKGGDFHEGRCRVLSGEGWGYIDSQGSVVAEGGPGPRSAWNDAEDFHGGLARVHTGGQFVESDHGPGFWKGGAWSYIDLQGADVALCRTDEPRLIAPPLGKEHDGRGP
jgi:hypothetical protein